MNCKFSGLQQQILIFSPFWRPEVQNRGRAGSSWRLRGESAPGFFWLLVAPAVSASWACGCIPTPSATVTTRPPPSIQNRLFLKDISRIRIKARQDGLVLTTSAKTLCPNKVPPTGPGGYEFGGVRFTLELPWWLSSKEPACNAGAAGDGGFLGQENPLEESMATHSRILA